MKKPKLTLEDFTKITGKLKRKEQPEHVFRKMDKELVEERIAEAKLEYPDVVVLKTAIDAIITEVNVAKSLLSDLNKIVKPKTGHIKYIRDELSTILRQLKQLRKGK